MRVDAFDYELPPERIAQEPVEPRDASRLLVLHRKTGEIEHRQFRELPSYVDANDLIVLNDTRVLPARLFGRRLQTGGKWEGLFLAETAEGSELMTRTGGKPAPGEFIEIEGADWQLELLRKTDNATWIARPTIAEPAAKLLPGPGHTPLPPYIREGIETAADRERYQTVFADEPGAVAAPTAGLHFTEELLERLRMKCRSIERVTLHVGPGTFQPVSVEDTDHHAMHFEWCRLTESTADRIRETKEAGGRVIAIGTTVVRTLETAAQAAWPLAAYAGSTNLFITPPYDFRVVDVLVTNFHLPKSTLLMLVSAFADRETILAAYHEAIRQEYRFYSYGDAMLII